MSFGLSQSWDSKGYCIDHEGVTEAMDGPEALYCVPVDLRARALKLIVCVIQLLEVEVEECHQYWSTKASRPHEEQNNVSETVSAGKRAMCGSR